MQQKRAQKRKLTAALLHDKNDAQQTSYAAAAAAFAFGGSASNLTTQAQETNLSQQKPKHEKVRASVDLRMNYEI